MESSSYCKICDRDFGDPDYHGTGPSVEEWKKHYEHLLDIGKFVGEHSNLTDTKILNGEFN